MSLDDSETGGEWTYHINDVFDQNLFHHSNSVGRNLLVIAETIHEFGYWKASIKYVMPCNVSGAVQNISDGSRELAHQNNGNWSLVLPTREKRRNTTAPQSNGA